MADEIKEETKLEIKSENKTLLESGNYELHAKDEKSIDIDKLELKGTNGSKRIWRLKSITPKEISFEIIKF